MVSVSYAGDNHVQLIMRPDQSLSWRGNQYLFLFITAWVVGFAMLFVAKGAWMVLPFVGLELVALGSALYYVSWKLSHQQVLEIGPDHVIITRGRQQPEYSHRFPRAELVVHVAPPDHPWDSPVIKLRANGRLVIRVGEFLNREDCARLLDLLRAARLPTRQGVGRVIIAF